MSGKVIVCRGLPGSGKSTLVQKLIKDKAPNEYVVCSADHFFMKGDKYIFDRNLLGAAHNSCKRNFLCALENQIPLVIVDNTNVVYRDFKEYIELGAAANYTVYLAESETSWRLDIDECFVRNTHGVPREVIASMKNKYQSNNEVKKIALENLGVLVNELHTSL